MSTLLAVFFFSVLALAGCATTQSLAPVVGAGYVVDEVPVRQSVRSTVAPFSGTYSCEERGESLVVRLSGGTVGQFMTWGGFGRDWTQGQSIAANAAGERVFPKTRWFNFTHRTVDGWTWEHVPDVLVNGHPVTNLNGSGCGIMNTMPNGLAQGGAALMRGNKNAARWPVAEVAAAVYPQQAAPRQFLDPNRDTSALPASRATAARKAAPAKKR